MKIKTIFVAVSIILSAACNPQNTLTVDIHDGESWWGLSNTDGSLQPFRDYSMMDLANDSRLGETVPFLVSSKGRYIWCDSPFTISCGDGKFYLKSYDKPINVVKAVCSKVNFPHFRFEKGTT